MLLLTAWRVSGSPCKETQGPNEPPKLKKLSWEFKRPRELELIEHSTREDRAAKRKLQRTAEISPLALSGVLIRAHL